MGGANPEPPSQPYGNTQLALWKLAARVAPSSLILMFVRSAVNILAASFKSGDGEHATRLAKLWVNALEPLAAPRRNPQLVDRAFKQCGADFAKTVDSGNVSQAMAVIRAGLEFALRVVETQNRLMIALIMDTWAPALELALDKYGPSAEETVASLGESIDLSTDQGRMEARALAGTLFVFAE